MYRDVLANPSVYLLVYAGPFLRERKICITVPPTESTSTGLGNNKEVVNSLSSNNISESGLAIEQDGPSIRGSYITLNAFVIVVGDIFLQFSKSFLVSL